MRILNSVLLVSVVALAACATDTTGGASASSYYDCDRGARLKVDYLGDDRVQVQMGDNEPLILPRVEAASGSKYMTAKHTFWDKGDEAMWTVGRMAPMTCRKAAASR